MEHLVAHFYKITSIDRQNGQTSQNFTISGPNLDDVHSLRIEEIVIPNTWYPVNSTNNQLAFNPNNTSFVTAIIPIGNYTVASFQTALANAMNLVSGGPTYVVSISTSSGIMTITQNAGNFVILNLSSSRYILGLDRSNQTTSSIGSVYKSTFIINLGGTNIVNIASRELLKFSTKSLTSESGSSSNHLCSVPVSTGFGSTIIYKPYNKYFTYNGTRGSQIDLQLYDEWNQPLNLNGGDWYISIKFHSDRLHNLDLRKHIKESDKADADYFTAMTYSSKN